MRQYLLKQDKADDRDYMLSAVINPTAKVKLPSTVDLRPKCPPVFNQESLGSCSANAGVACRMMLSGVQTVLSRLFLYYKEREMEGTIMQDSGATIRDICVALNKYGVCEETLMPYNVNSFTASPSLTAQANAAKYKIMGYSRIMTPGDIKMALALTQKPVLIGMKIFESIEKPSVAISGKLPMPKPTEAELGGHAVLVVGYKDSLFGDGYFIVRNSWGPGWGDKGYFYMPYKYADKYTFDYWTIS